MEMERDFWFGIVALLTAFVVQDEVSVQQEEENVEQAEEKKSLKGRFGLYMIESYVEIRRDLLEEVVCVVLVVFSNDKGRLSLCGLISSVC